jgi:hypothetical protein
VDSDVIGEIEGRSVDPQRPAQPPPGPVEQLPEAGDQVQPRLEVSPDRVDPETTIVVEQPGAVEDGEPADVAGPAEVVPLQQEQVRRCQPLQHRPLRHHLTLASEVA